MSKSPPSKAWSLAVLEAVAALSLLIASAFPLSPRSPDHLEQAMGALLLACSAATFTRRRQITDRLLLAQAATGIAITALLAANDVTNTGVFLTTAGFLWVALWVAGFYSPRMLTLCLAAEFVAALAAAGLNDVELRTLAIGMSVLAVTAIATTMMSHLIWDLRRQAGQDHLTGLRNRHGVDAALGELDWRRRGDRPLSLVVFDVDGLKTVNDRDGHVAGDQLLATFATELSRAARRTDVTARIGGDEFVAILPGTTDADARAWATELRARSTVAWSFGIAERVSGEPFESWLGRADDCLYEAKTRARAGGTLAAQLPPSHAETRALA